MTPKLTQKDVNEAKREYEEAYKRWCNIETAFKAQQKNGGEDEPEKVQPHEWNDVLQKWLSEMPVREEPVRNQTLELPDELRAFFRRWASKYPIPADDKYGAWKIRGDFMLCPRCGKNRIYCRLEDIHRWADPKRLYSDEDPRPFCDTCTGKSTTKTVAQIEWENKTPTAYTEGKTATDVAKLPDPVAWAKLADWTPVDGLKDRKSLYICGKNRCGKSRMLFELLKRRVCPTVFSLRIMLAGDLRQLSLEQSNGSYSEQWVKDLERVDVLAFDDFDKSAMTDTSVRALFSILDFRLSNMKPTILVSNYTTAELPNLVKGKGEFAEANMAGIVNRIAEYAVVLKVKP